MASTAQHGGSQYIQYVIVIPWLARLYVEYLSTGAQLFYTTYISVDLAHHEMFPANVGKGGINLYVHGCLLVLMTIASSLKDISSFFVIRNAKTNTYSFYLDWLQSSRKIERVTCLLRSPFLPCSTKGVRSTQLRRHRV